MDPVSGNDTPTSSDDLSIDRIGPAVLALTKTTFAPFAAALAHEIRNPLSNITLAVGVLKEMCEDDEQQRYFDIILRAGAKINGLVTDLIGYEHSDAATSQGCLINRLLDDVIERTTDRIMLKNIHVIREYILIDRKIYIDSQKVKIALVNIIINAIDAMPVDDGKLWLRTKVVNGKCSIEIEDNGIGISPENLKNIFEPYYTNKPGGMGLGLSTTLHSLKADHATIDVRSIEGMGTCFTLCFDTAQ